MSFEKHISAEPHVVCVSITVASLQFLISAVQQLPAGQLEFTLILYAASSCLFYRPSKAIIKTGLAVMCFLIGC